MKKIVLTSKNQTKYKATLNGFKSMFPDEDFEIESVSIESGVRKQPLSSEETLTGAMNRARNASLRVKANYWVGIEGGVDNIDDEAEAFTWVVIMSENIIGKAKTGIFILPEKVARLLRDGKELSEADDIVFGVSDSKQELGAVGILTGNVIDRAKLYEQAVVLALIPFRNASLY
jgi:inosine/xanthosine triphosphatase